jgi:Bacterial sugar transferase
MATTCVRLSINPTTRSQNQPGSLALPGFFVYAGACQHYKANIYKLINRIDNARQGRFFIRARTSEASPLPRLVLTLNIAIDDVNQWIENANQLGLDLDKPITDVRTALVALSATSDLTRLGTVECLDVVFAPRGASFIRVFDVVFSLLMIVWLLPILCLTACIIKLWDGGPVLCRHRRVGLDGEHFDCLKFPTETPVGLAIRKLGYDELPQLFNILRGDMSFVGCITEA